MLSRRLLVTTTAGLAAMAEPLRAASFPARPIRMLCTGPAGSSTDLPLRAACEFAARRLGQPIIIDNRSGAGGAVAAQAAAQSRPDGYTLCNGTVSLLRAALLTSTGYDPLTDLTYVAQLGGYTVGIVVKADAPWRDWAELITWARTNPGKLTYAVPGVGTGGHIAMEVVVRQAGVEATVVPYRGSSDCLSALLAGSVELIADGAYWAGAVRDGAARLLAIVSSAQRLSRYPDVPTLNELGYEFDGTASLGIIGPKGLARDVVAPIEAAMREAMEDPGVKAVFDRFDLTPAYQDSAAYDTAMRRITLQERRIIQTLGLIRS